MTRLFKCLSLFGFWLQNFRVSSSLLILFYFLNANFLIIQQQFSTRNHPLSILVENYFREFLISKFICSVFPIKLEKNDSFKRPRKSYRFRGLLWLIFGLLHDLFEVKCKERIEILHGYVKNDQLKSLSYDPY